MGSRFMDHTFVEFGFWTLTVIDSSADSVLESCSSWLTTTELPSCNFSCSAVLVMSSISSEPTRRRLIGKSSLSLHLIDLAMMVILSLSQNVISSQTGSVTSSLDMMQACIFKGWLRLFVSCSLYCLAEMVVST